MAKNFSRYRQVERTPDFGKMHQIDAPQDFSVAIRDEPGNVTGLASYAVTFVTARGETEPTAEANQPAANPTNQKVDVTLPIGPAGVIARKIYRGISSGNFLYEYKLVGTVNDNTTTLFTDNVAIGSEGPLALQMNTTGGLLQYVNGVRVARADQAGTDFGYGAGNPNGKGMHNTNNGYMAGNKQNLTYWNCNYGAFSGEEAEDGYECCNYGYRAGQKAKNPTYNAIYGTLAGYLAGQEEGTQSANRTLMGYAAGAKATTSANSTHIGQRAGSEILEDIQNTTLGSVAGTFVSGDGDVLLTEASSVTYVGYGTRAKQQGVYAETVLGAFAEGEGSYTSTIGMWDQYYTRINGYLDIRARHFSAGLQMRRVNASKATQAMLGWFNSDPSTSWILRTSSDNANWDRDVMTIATDRSVVFGGLIRLPILTWHGSNDVPTPQGRLYFGNNDSTYINGYGTTPIRLQSNYGGVAEYNTSTGWAFMVDGSLKTISVGAVDSGGTGFKLLRVPN